MILSCYPDFGKVPPEYVVNLVDLLSTYSEPTLVKLCDLRTGVASQCAYIPALAEIVKMADYIEDAADLENLERIRAEERANFMRAAESRLVEAKKRHPTAQLDSEGRIFYFPDLEKEKKTPTPEQIEQGEKVTQVHLLHQTRLSKYDRLN